MVDQKLADLTAATSLTTDDIFYVVDDPSGDANDRKLAVSVLDARYLVAANDNADIILCTQIFS